MFLKIASFQVGNFKFDCIGRRTGLYRLIALCNGLIWGGGCYGTFRASLINARVVSISIWILFGRGNIKREQLAKAEPESAKRAWEENSFLLNLLRQSGELRTRQGA